MEIINNQILKSEETVIEIAQKLANLCHSFNFEGWLLNVESSVIKSKVPLLKLFVEKVTQFTHEKVPGSVVIWYDSVIYNGTLRWQNELNTLNE